MTDAKGGGGAQTVTELLVAQLKRIRRRRGLTVAALADRCAGLGSAETTANVLANIEAGRRQVNVNQLAALALALDVAPVHLLACPDGQDVQVTSTACEPASAWQAWLLARAPLPEGDENAFWAYCLENADTDDASRALIDLARQRTTATTHKIVSELQEHSQTQLTQLRSIADRGLDAIQEAASSGDAGQVLAAVKLARSLIGTTSAAT